MKRPFDHDGVRMKRCSLRCPQRTRAAAESCGLSAETADATTGELHAIDVDDFARVRPIFRPGDEFGALGILANVIPFRTVRYVIPEQTIEKSRLPKRLFLGRSERD